MFKKGAFCTEINWKTSIFGIKKGTKAFNNQRGSTGWQIDLGPQICPDKDLNLVEVNLEKHLELTEFFQKNNPSQVLDAVSDLLSREIKWFDPKAKILFFIDEIQAVPAAIACLRYFYEEFPDFPVVCAGSLLEFALNDLKYSMPVGRIEFLYMGPMTFHEFLIAKGEKYLLKKMMALTELKQISDVFHQKMHQTT